MRIAQYNWHPYTRRRYAFAVCAVAGGLAVWFAMRGESDWLPRIIPLCFVLISLFLIVEQSARVDVATGTVIRDGRLFGRYLVWRWRNRLSDFTGVGFLRNNDPEGGDTVFVGLRRRSGRLMAIQYFFVGSGFPCNEAERVGRSLSENTGLPLNEHVA